MTRDSTHIISNKEYYKNFVPINLTTRIKFLKVLEKYEQYSSMSI